MSIQIKKRPMQIGRFLFDEMPKIMGVLNLTPDSFFDGGKYQLLEQALRRTEQMLEAGADIIDIGAESSHPDAEPISEKEELKRLLPVLEAIQSRFHVCISIDTQKAKVMQACLDRGADLINDINALSNAEQLIPQINEKQIGVCLMHRFRHSEVNENSADILLSEVCEFLAKRASSLMEQGVQAEQIILDPGFGFSKSVVENFSLIHHIEAIATAPFKAQGIKTANAISTLPVLIGLSHKGSLGTLLGDRGADRTHASVAGALLAVVNGARIIRVHDVKATADALAVYHAIYC